MRTSLAAVLNKAVSWIKLNRRPAAVMGASATALVAVLIATGIAVAVNDDKKFNRANSDVAIGANNHGSQPLGSSDSAPTSAAPQTPTSVVTPQPGVDPQTGQQIPAAPAAGTPATPAPAGVPQGPTAPAPTAAPNRPNTKPDPSVPQRNDSTPSSAPAASIVPARDFSVNAVNVTDTFLPEDPRVAIEVNASDNLGYISRISVNWQVGVMPVVRDFDLASCASGPTGFPSSSRKERFEYNYPEGGGYNVVVAVTSSDCNGNNERTNYARVNLTAASGTTTVVPTPPVTVAPITVPVSKP